MHNATSRTLAFAILFAISACASAADTTEPSVDEASAGLTVKRCARLGGVVATDPGDGSGGRCREGELRFTLSDPALIEGGACCRKDRPLRARTCTAAGGLLVTNPGDGTLASCPAGGETLGTLKDPGILEGGLCCGRPRVVSFAACEDEGGVARTSRGDGEPPACPTGTRPVGRLDPAEAFEGGVCCR